MEYHSKFKATAAPSGLEMTEIPGLKSNPYILRGNKRDDSRSHSPSRYVASGKNAEMLTSDLVRSNETKVK